VQKAKDLRRETMERVDQLKAGYFQAAFNGPETDHWQKVKLVTISRITSGGTPSRRDPFNFIGEIRWVKTLDLNCDVVRETEECISESALTQIRGEILPVGTVMIAMYGGAGTIGKSGILGIPAATNQAICSILPNPEVFVPEFLHYWVLLIRSKWMDYGVGTRIDPNINKGIIERMDFLLPSLAEQCRVVAYLDDLQAREDPLGQLQAETGTRLDALLPSILDKAFKGQLH
jgi:type I restriction enzyme S subunit